MMEGAVRRVWYPLPAWRQRGLRVELAKHLIVDASRKQKIVNRLSQPKALRLAKKGTCEVPKSRPVR